MQDLRYVGPPGMGPLLHVGIYKTGNSEEAMSIKQAIEILDDFVRYHPQWDSPRKALTALRELRPATPEEAYAEFATTTTPQVNDPWGWFNTGFHAAERRIFGDMSTCLACNYTYTFGKHCPVCKSELIAKESAPQVDGPLPEKGASRKSDGQVALTMEPSAFQRPVSLPPATADQTPETDARVTRFDAFINEPPQYEDQRKVREYRHELYPKWLEVFHHINDLERRLSAAHATLEATREQWVIAVDTLNAERKAREEVERNFKTTWEIYVEQKQRAETAEDALETERLRGRPKVAVDPEDYGTPHYRKE